MSKKTLILSSTIIISFIIASFMAIKTAKQMVATDSIATDTPDFFMTQAIYTKFNKEGEISNRIITKKITHLVTNDIYLFEEPRITIYNPNEQPWFIRSKHGKSEKTKSKVFLWDNVKLIQKPGVNNLGFNISTTALTIYPDKKFATTDLPINIIQQQNIVDAVGAELDLKNSSIKLLSKIRGSYIIIDP